MKKTKALSLLLSLLLLYKSGYDVGKYVSFEEQINRYKGYYYDALQQSSSEWENGQNDYFPFMENFLSTLYMCYKELDKRFAVITAQVFQTTVERDIHRAIDIGKLILFRLFILYGT